MNQDGNLDQQEEEVVMKFQFNAVIIAQMISTAPFADEVDL